MQWPGTVEYWQMINDPKVAAVLSSQIDKHGVTPSDTFMDASLELFYRAANAWEVDPRTRIDQICMELFPRMETIEKSDLANVVLSAWAEIYTN